MSPSRQQVHCQGPRTGGQCLSRTRPGQLFWPMTNEQLSIQRRCQQLENQGRGGWILTSTDKDQEEEEAETHGEKKLRGKGGKSHLGVSYRCFSPSQLAPCQSSLCFRTEVTCWASTLRCYAYSFCSSLYPMWGGKYIQMKNQNLRQAA